MKAKWFCMILAGAMSFSIAGCGSKEKEQAATEEKQATAAPAAPIDMATVGEVTGSVKLEGAPPTFKPINMSAEAYCAKAHSSPVMPEEVVTGSGGSLENVIVYVKEGLGDRTFDVPKQAVELNQKGCMYQPHVVALMAGQELQVKNDDQTTHNIHPMPKDNREWNKSQPPGSSPIEDSFARPEVAIPVKCNVHPWMKAYIGVLSSPYFQITGKDGSFSIANVPPGTYTVTAWHELYGTQDQ
ncbi:MAG: carboxypeptidase regulatory-like domain-containing protein, partial [Candidatus Acidiferrales bacterium]